MTSHDISDGGLTGSDDEKVTGGVVRTALQEYLDRLVSCHIALSPDGRVIFTNSAALALAKLPGAELKGRRIWDADCWHMTEDTLRRLEGLVKRADFRTPARLEGTVIRGGTETAVDISVAAAADSSGKTTYFTVEICETARPPGKQGTGDAWRLLNGLINCSPVAMFMIDREHRVLFWNLAMEKLTGVPAKEVVGTSDHWKALYNNMQPCMVDILVDGKVRAAPEGSPGSWAASSAIPGGFEWTVYLYKSERWIRVTTIAITDDEGCVVGGVEIVADITERKQTKEALRESEEKFRVLAETSPIAISVIQNEHLAYMNPAYERISGYTREELQHMKFWDTIHPEDREMTRARGSARLRGEEVPASYEIRMLARDGRVKWVWINAGLIEYRGQPASVVTAIDITELKQAEEIVRQSEEKYRTIFENTMTATAIIDEDTTVSLINTDMATRSGYSKEEVEGRESFLKFVAEEDVELARKYHQECMASRTDSRRVREIHILPRNGSVIDVICKIALIPGTKKCLISFTDITEHKRAEKTLRESEEKFRVLAETSPAAICVYQGKHLAYVNPAYEMISGYTREELQHTHFWDLVHPDHQHLVRERGLSRQNGEDPPVTNEIKIVTKEGKIKWMLATAGVIKYNGKPAGISMLVDITERKQAEDRLRGSLKEKEVLLKEIHHRVKNNLQIITSLLNLQSSSIEDPASVRAFADSQNRIRSMALVHEKLYMSNDFQDIDFADYISSLAYSLHRSYATRSDRIRLILDTEKINLGIDAAIPLGLIANELIANAFKHAFPGDRQGTLAVKLRSTDQGKLELYVTDDGVGMPAGFDIEKSGSLGLQLVDTLARQLEGDLRIVSAGGTSVSLSCPSHARKAPEA